MLALKSNAEKHLIIVPSLIRQLEFLFLPPVCHFGKSYYIREHFNFYYIILMELEPKRFAVKSFIGIRIAPPVAVQHIRGMPKRFVVVKLILIFLNRMPEENSKKYPGTNIKPIEANINFAGSLANISKIRPIEVSISSPNNTIRNSI